MIDSSSPEEEYALRAIFKSALHNLCGYLPGIIKCCVVVLLTDYTNTCVFI